MTNHMFQNFLEHALYTFTSLEGLLFVSLFCNDIFFKHVTFDSLMFLLIIGEKKRRKLFSWHACLIHQVICIIYQLFLNSST